MIEKDQRIQDIKEISLAIDTWDDIFSDFDPRPLNERTLSEDFIAELRKRYREKLKGKYLITIYAPSSLEDAKTEKVVFQRLKHYFRHRAMSKKREVVRIRIRGIIFVTFGIMFLSFLTLTTYYKFFGDLAIEILGIILMPLGWFGIWEGFSKIVDTSFGIIQDQMLFEKLSKATYRMKYIENEK